MKREKRESERRSREERKRTRLLFSSLPFLPLSPSPQNLRQNPPQTNKKVHQEPHRPHRHRHDQRDLIATDVVISLEIDILDGDGRPPPCRLGDAGERSGEEVGEGEGEEGGPEGDGEEVEGCEEEFGGEGPDADGTAPVFEVDGEEDVEEGYRGVDYGN